MSDIDESIKWAPQGAVVRAHHLAQLSDAEAVLNEARKWSDEFRKETDAKIQDEYEKAVIEGEKAGIQKFVTLSANLKSRFDTVEADLHRVLRLACQRLVDELPPDAVFDSIVRDVLVELRTCLQLTICVHHSKLDAMTLKVKELLSSNGYKIEVDDALAPTECVFLTDSSVFTTSHAIAVDQLLAHLGHQVGPPPSNEV